MDHWNQKEKVLPIAQKAYEVLKEILMVMNWHIHQIDIILMVKKNKDMVQLISSKIKSIYFCEDPKNLEKRRKMDIPTVKSLSNTTKTNQKGKDKIMLIL
ncbi:MAG: hypothetical protein IPP01_12155 [Saprospiraceae bacterium]|nr:hypothetical protein [Saprospiraceae bacterium]